MAVVVKKNESKELKTIGFSKSDHVVVKLKKSGNEKAVHKILADKLVKAKKAEIVKGAELEEKKNTKRQVIPVADNK